MASTVTNRQESHSTNSNPSLPEDLILSCLARVSKLHYPSLSLVSKSFQSLLTSPELYKTRSLLNRTELCLYVCLHYPSEPNPRWFTLSLKPNKTLTSKNEEYALARVSFTNSPPVEWTDLIVVDHRLYAVGEATKAAPCSNVSFLDCRTHTWLEAPSLRLSHANAISQSDLDKYFKVSNYLEGQMYLPGSYENYESLNCVEVFDTKSHTWKPVPPEKRIFKPKDMEGKILINSHTASCKKGCILKSKERELEKIGSGMESIKGSCCMISKGCVVYSYDFRRFEWWVIWSGVPRKVEGLERLPKFPNNSSVKLVEYGGKVVVLWDEYVLASGSKEKVIWCGVIALEERGGHEIWGKVEWFDAVLRVPESYKFVYAIAATV